MTQFILNKFAGLQYETSLINGLLRSYFSRALFSDSLETAVSRKLMAASIFYYYSAKYKESKRITWILLALTFLLF